jgi:MFS family permease
MEQPSKNFQIAKMKIPRLVFLFGLGSFFNDIASKMVFPLLPVYLVSVLGAGPLTLGLIEGFAQTIASLSKLVSGQLADKTSRGKTLILGGYLFSNIFRPLLGVTSGWGQVLVLRAGERIGKGIRTPPRDSFIIRATPAKSVGQAFGFNRMMDYFGSFLGPILAALLMMKGFEIKSVFLLSVIPGGIAVLVIFGALKSLPSPPVAKIEKKALIKLPKFENRFKGFVWVAAVMTLAGIPESFLILWLLEIKVTQANVPLIWAGASALKIFFAVPAGNLADKFGGMPTLLGGWVLKIIALFIISLTGSFHAFAITIFVLFVALTAAIDPVERATLGTLVPKSQRGAAFGLFQMVSGLFALPAALIFSSFWKTFGYRTAFFYSICLTIFAALLFFFIVFRNREKIKPTPIKKTSTKISKTPQDKI